MASKYYSMSLTQLKDELKHRQARLSGRKKELIERLEAYDRNQNFGKEKDIAAEFEMTLPKAEVYRDLHGNMKLAPVSFDLAYEFLSQFNTEFDDTSTTLYKERYLVYLRLGSTDTFDFVKSACRASMKKQVLYEVDISFKKCGSINETQCECGAGQGPTGHCKHIRAVLYACCKFVKTGQVIVEMTCTEKLQSFHKVKRFVGSPLKAKDLSMDGSDEVCNFKDFDPRPQKYRKMKSYPSYFRNLCLNFKGISTMPIFQLFAPANALAVAHDHDYLDKTPEDIFLSAFGVSEMSQKEYENIEFCTRGQNINERWHEERTKRIQSSNFGRICTATDRCNLKKLANTLTSYTPTFKSDAILHGQKYEKEAIRVYERNFGLKVKECGIFVSKALPFIGASPDGVIDKETICEVKCPYTAKNKDISPVTVPYLVNDNNSLQLKTTHHYYYQIQGQLFCSETQFCDLIVYTLKDIKYIRIERDNNFISGMLASLQAFYDKYFCQALLEKNFYKSL